jgi:cobyrinic acid a,c-diamide synthase
MPACPALLISAPASGQGKTTITAGLARLHRRQGRRVRVFKAGPDFLDPTILSRASGAPVLSLDLWMVGEQECRRLLAEAAREADLILIEGVMGLFDGTPSSADLAATFRVPVAAVISASAMAQTFGALAFGLARYRPDVPFHGVLANHVGSARHAQMLEQALPSDLRWLGHVAASERMELPGRHLGLHRADEIDDLEARIECAADALADTALADLPASVDFPSAPVLAPPRLLDGLHVAIARDAAFSFIYPANAESIRAHASANKTLVAECGGMLYLLESLTDAEGTATSMLGLLPGHATMQTRLAALGMQELDTRHGTMTGHTFHYSRVTTPLNPERHATRPQRGAVGEPVFRHGSIIATYMHGYWPSNPALTAALFHGEPL